METERRVDRYVHLVLKAGMMVSISVLLLGLVLFAAAPGGAEENIPLDQLPEELMAGSPIAVIDLGIILLIATPLARVLTAAAVFAMDREFRFVLISIAVIAAIVLAVLLG